MPSVTNYKKSVNQPNKNAPDTSTPLMMQPMTPMTKRNTSSASTRKEPKRTNDALSSTDGM